MAMNLPEFFKKAICTLVALFIHTAFTFSAEVEFVPISTGREFIMGSPDTNEIEAVNRGGSRTKLAHQVAVYLTRDFEIQTTEVTQEQWFEVMEGNPSYWKEKRHCPNRHQIIGTVKLCPNNAVEQVSWHDVQDFIVKLNQQKNDGYTYRLPTEAEWEYAARAGTETAYFFGDNPSDLGVYSWYWGNLEIKTQRVGQKLPNPWRLRDIYGNVNEWVQDYYNEDLPGGTDPLQNSGVERVARGGSFVSDEISLRSAARASWEPESRESAIGFRLVRIPAQ